MAKASGVNTKVAKKAYNKVKTELNQLEQHIQSLQKNVERMNKDTWYGGKSSANWYARMQKVYANLVTFDNGVNSFQNSLKSQFTKSTASGIDF